jgi:hypothetical protein
MELQENRTLLKKLLTLLDMMETTRSKERQKTAHCYIWIQKVVHDFRLLSVKLKSLI